MLNLVSLFGVVAKTDFDRATSSAFWLFGLTTKYLTGDVPWLPGVELTAWGLEQGVVGRLPLGLLPVEELPDRLSPGVLGVPLKYDVITLSGWNQSSNWDIIVKKNKKNLIG